jgi:glycosyltransferase involved in cell wall biosynthesis
MNIIDTNPGPTISCIMPTNNRRGFVPNAISYFLQQDYKYKELLIVDDGTDIIEDIVPANEQIRYIRLHNKMTLGEKRNYCIKESIGDLIMHWDDDDWMAPYRISYQVQELLKNKAEVCGLQQMLFRELDTGKCWLYKYPLQAQPWLAGGSLLYTRDFWQQSPFPDMQIASDTRFIFARKLTSFVVLSDYRFYVATIHCKNTSAKNTASNLWKPIENNIVKKIMDEEGDNGAIAEKITKPVIGHISTRLKETEQIATACLLSFKRPGNIQKIIDSIHDYAFIDEILVWNNNPEINLAVTGSKVRVINATENKICYGRFLCAKEAKNDTIYFQDDDAIIDNVPELYYLFLKDPSCITYGLSKRHFQILDKYIYPETQVSFLGWGSFIKKTWLKVFDDYLQKNGTDYIFLREADKFFTLLLRKKNNAIEGKIQLLEYDSVQGYALYLEKSHTLYVALAIRRALEFNRIIKNIIPVTWNIVITCSNYGHFLEEAVNSVLYNHADYIITIVDDHSSDNTLEICQNLIQKYPFIKYIRNKIKMGTGYSRNIGVASADSIFVVFLDADDKIGQEYLFEAEKLLRTGYDVVNPDALLFGSVVTRWPVPENVTLKMQLNRNHVHCCSAFRRSYWAQVGGIDESMRCWEDYEFWIRLAEAGARIKKISGDHFYYRKHGESRSGTEQDAIFASSYIHEKHKSLFKKSF